MYLSGFPGNFELIYQPISLWGKVRQCTPLHLVLPITVEPSKPHLCNDDRFLNLWIEDRPFSLDSVQHLPNYVHKGFYQTVCDEKSGYDHIKLHPSSRTYFGFQWGRWHFVSECIPFGWKLIFRICLSYNWSCRFTWASFVEHSFFVVH